MSYNLVLSNVFGCQNLRCRLKKRLLPCSRKSQRKFPTSLGVKILMISFSLWNLQGGLLWLFKINMNLTANKKRNLRKSFWRTKMWFFHITCKYSLYRLRKSANSYSSDLQFLLLPGLRFRTSCFRYYSTLEQRWGKWTTGSLFWTDTYSVTKSLPAHSFFTCG